MIEPQISGQTGSLTRAGLKLSARIENTLVVTPRYGGAHSLPHSSSVPDPSHSPIERGQGHGVRERVWKKVGCGVGMGSGGGSWLGKGTENGIGELGLKIIFRKEFDLWSGFLTGTEFLTRRIILSQRSLDG